jgi:hypothetical protein
MRAKYMTNEKEEERAFPPPKEFLVSLRVRVGQQAIFQIKGAEDYDSEGPFDEAAWVSSELGWAGQSFDGLEIKEIKENPFYEHR